MRSNRTVSLALAGLLAVALVPSIGTPAAPASAVRAAKPGLASLSSLPATLTQHLVGIATFDAVPSAAEARGLRKLGLTVQPMKHLPLAIVLGTLSQLRNAVAKGLANDVYPNEKLEWHSKESRGSVRADKLATPLTGKGVGVAILDTGIDATHPDLADHVTHNVKMVGPEYLGITGMYVDPNMPPGTLVLPVDSLPYNNGDNSGHGTHVAGIVAADGTTSEDQVGMAPDAELIGYSAGDVALIFTIVAAFDHMIEHRDDWNIDVVNNSWGGSFRVFDPAHPINVATKAVTDAGIVVTFSAGNSSTEMQVNPWSVAPWVISVGSGTTSAQRSDFSSGGLEFDNSAPIALPEDGHVRFTGDRVGIYHPDISAPGTAIVSSGTPTGTYVNLGTVPPAPGGTATASGTSMAAPHVAGLAALLLQANPKLTPAQVREIMQVTSAGMRDNTPFWHAGYGWIDVPGAVALARRPNLPTILSKMQAARDHAVQGARKFGVLSSDLWSFTPTLPATAFGLDGLTLEVDVPAQTKAFKASVAYPAVPLVGNPLALYDWQLVVTDAAGTEVATSVVSDAAGLSSVFVDLVNPSKDAAGNAVPAPKVTYGTWTIEVLGNLWTVDPTEVLAVRQVNVSFVQLAPQKQILGNVARFVKTSDYKLYLQPDGTGGPATSPEGCPMQAGSPTGGLATTKAAGECQAGLFGYPTSFGAGIPAEFVSEPLKAATTIGGPSLITLYLVDEAQPAFGAYGSGVVGYALDAITNEGETVGVGGGDLGAAITAPTPSRGEYKLVIPPTVVPAGSTLRLSFTLTCFCSSTTRMVFGGEYADAGITTGIGSFSASGSPSAPAPAPKPAVKGAKQLPATGVASSALGYLLVASAAALAFATRRSRRTPAADRRT